MKNYISNLFSVLCAVLLLQSCYKDMGNYDYTTEGGALTIPESFSQSMSGIPTDEFTFKVGTTVEIEAQYVINDQMLKDDQLAFEWYFGDEVVSTEKKLVLDGLGAANYTGLLVITDLRYDTKYSAAFGFLVEDLYTMGWALLSEKDGYSILSYMELTDDSKPVFTDDVYGKSNEGDRLAAGVRSMSYHQYDTSPYTYGLNIVQPGDNGPIELNPNNMGVIGRYAERFISPMPGKEFTQVANTNVNGMAYVYALTSDDELYIREESTFNGSMVPHTGYFPANPLTVEGGVEISHLVRTDIICKMMTSEWGGSLIAYDKLNSRSLILHGLMAYPFDESFHYKDTGLPYKGSVGYDGTNEYPELVTPGPEDLKDYDVVGMYALGFGVDWIMGFDDRISVAMLLKRKTDSKLFFMTYRIQDYYGQRFRLEIDLFFPVPDGISIDPDNFVATGNLGATSNILYFMANDNRDLYYLDGLSGAVKKIYSSGDEVTALGMGMVNDVMILMDELFGMAVWPSYYEKMIVGKKTGDLDIIQVDAMSRIDGNASVVSTLSTGAGEIKHIAFMPNAAFTF